jgi:hypothetical protein
MTLRYVLGGNNLGHQGQAPTPFLVSGTKGTKPYRRRRATPPTSFTHLWVAPPGPMGFLVDRQTIRHRHHPTVGRGLSGGYPERAASEGATTCDTVILLRGSASAAGLGHSSHAQRGATE